MKKIFVVVCTLFSTYAFASPNFLKVGKTYVGFGPTDESAVQLGEIQITVLSNTQLQMSMATGLSVFTETEEIADLRELSAAEMQAMGLPVEELRVFKGSSGYPIIVVHEKPQSLLQKVMKKVSSEPYLTIYTGGMGDLISPLILYSPEQVAAGEFEKAIQKIEAASKKNVVPRIKFDGKAEKQGCGSLIQ